MPIFFAVFAVLLALPVVAPQMDLFLSGLFYSAGEGGFFLSDYAVFKALSFLAYYGARVLAVALLILALVSWARQRASSLPPAGSAKLNCHKYISCGNARERGGRKKGLLFFSAKAWLFLFLALLIGPGLVANVGFKDHWGRARPREIVEFGGSETFSPALMPQFEKARSNGSFISGDGAFGFFLPAFAYVAPRKSARRVFWGGMAAGVAFGFARLATGAHFFSDIVHAAFFMLAVCAGIHAAMYGAAETKTRWKIFFTRSSDA